MSNQLEGLGITLKLASDIHDLLTTSKANIDNVKAAIQIVASQLGMNISDLAPPESGPREKVRRGTTISGSTTNVVTSNVKKRRRSTSPDKSKDVSKKFKQTMVTPQERKVFNDRSTAIKQYLRDLDRYKTDLGSKTLPNAFHYEIAYVTTVRRLIRKEKPTERAITNALAFLNGPLQEKSTITVKKVLYGIDVTRLTSELATKVQNHVSPPEDNRPLKDANPSDNIIERPIDASSLDTSMDIN